MARILIVDDSPTETFRFKEILTKHGYDTYLKHLTVQMV